MKNIRGKIQHLCNIGEKNIIQNVIYDIFPHLQKFHDDAVVLDVAGLNQIVVSTDPCPEPVINLFDAENKYYHYGRMSVLINYSDLAADGAIPIGIVLSTVMKDSMLVNDYTQFLLGVKDSCHEWGGQLLGGNVKEGREFSVTGTSLGTFEVGARRIGRVGTSENDIVCVVGDLGMFWLAVLKLWQQNTSLSELDDYTKSFLLNPRPKLYEGAILSQNKSVTTCMDSSDGIIGCLYELAGLNNVTIYIDEGMLVPNDMLLEFCTQNKYES
jgi:thiamine-monophosphate kinase